MKPSVFRPFLRSLSLRRSLCAAVSLLLLLPILCGCGLKRVENDAVTTLSGTWDRALDFSEGLAAVKKDGKWGFIDTDGNEVIPLKYDDVHSFSEGLAAVRSGANYGYVDKTGKTVIPATFSYTHAFFEGRAIYGEGTKYGFIDTTGAKVIPAVYTEVTRFRDGLACVKKDGAFGFIDSDGNPVTAFEFGDSSAAAEGRIAVFHSKATAGINTGYLDLKGEIALDFQWYDGRDFSEGMAAVQPEFPGKWGYIDTSGQTVLEAQWDSAEEFIGGIALVGIGKKFTFIKTDGTPITRTEYDKAYPFSADGLARVGIASGADYRFGFLDRSGKEVIEPQYENALDFHNGYAAVCKNGKWGFIRADGSDLTGLNWEQVGEITEEGLAWVRHKDEYTFIKLK